MDVELRIIADCPNSAPAQAMFAQALELEGLDPSALAVLVVGSDAEAAELGFHGSPSFVIDGSDLFPSATEPAVTCRVYQTEAGLKGRPSLESLRDAVRGATNAGSAR